MEQVPPYPHPSYHNPAPHPHAPGSYTPLMNQPTLLHGAMASVNSPGAPVQSWENTTCCDGHTSVRFYGKSITVERTPTCCCAPCLCCKSTTVFSTDSVAYLENPATVALTESFLMMFFLTLSFVCIGCAFLLVNGDYVDPGAIVLWTIGGVSIPIFLYYLVLLCRNCCCSPIHFRVNTGLFGERHSVVLPNADRDQVLAAFAEVIHV